MNDASLLFARQFASGASGLTELLRGTVVEVRTPGGCGAGIIWGGSGHIVTNAHCAPRGPALQIRADGQSYTGRVVAYSREHDLALISAPRIGGQLLELRDAESLRIGELVFAHGHPLGMRDSLAMGVVHDVARDARTHRPKFIVADVRLAPGNSGGPLVDADGRLVGINSMVVNGLGVAVPAHAAEQFVARALASRAA
jgi:serine protease Do